MIALYVDPTSHHLEGDRLFRQETVAFGGADILAPWAYMRDWMRGRAVTVRTADALDRAPGEGDINVYVSFGRLGRWKRIVGRNDVTLAGFIALECPIVEPRLYHELSEAAEYFPRVFATASGQALQPFITPPVGLERWDIPQSFDGVHQRLWVNAGRRFLTMISANKVPRLRHEELYTERLRALAVFARYADVDLFGVGWDGPAFRVGESWLPGIARRAGHRLRAVWEHLYPPPLWRAARSVWRGVARDKARVLSQYRFALCFENARLEWWITEKIFDCLFSGTVPVYLGAPDITDVVDAECFVDARRFGDYEALRHHLHDLSDEDVDAMRHAGREYLASARFDRFRKETFARRMGGFVEQATGAALPAPG